MERAFRIAFTPEERNVYSRELSEKCRSVRKSGIRSAIDPMVLPLFRTEQEGCGVVGYKHVTPME
jgi:hypothetical protein